jgi:hypothetical protein
MKSYYYGLIAAEVSHFSKYFGRLVNWNPLPHDQNEIFKRIIPAKSSDESTLFFLNGHFNYSIDIQGLLAELKPELSRSSRIVVVAYNPYLRSLYAWLKKSGFMSGPVPTTFLSTSALESFCRLGGFEVVKQRYVASLPFQIPFISWAINKIFPILPLIRHLSLAQVVMLRPKVELKKTSLSIVIPARNEKGNVPSFLARLPDFGEDDAELIIVEGNSTDGTWEAVQELVASAHGKVPVRAFKQTGKGKHDAVRKGFSEAKGEILIILDADLTMPPEMLPRFVTAYKEGVADFINGSRLIYPMEGEAMRFLNLLGNAFFSKAVSYVLSLNLSDTLCGTKVLSRTDYNRIKAWRQDFGDFDPFGDFELLFGSSVLGLGTVDLPIHYKARTYGSTNIRRFYHGSMLLKMCFIGLFRLKIRFF